MVSCTPISLAVVRKDVLGKKRALTKFFLIVRFWGWTENAAEVAKDKAELSQLAKEGKPLYGESYMPEHIQDSSARNSRFSQLKFGT